jgi:hypothetical protein
MRVTASLFRSARFNPWGEGGMDYVGDEGATVGTNRVLHRGSQPDPGHPGGPAHFLRATQRSWRLRLRVALGGGGGRSGSVELPTVLAAHRAARRRLSHRYAVAAVRTVHGEQDRLVRLAPARRPRSLRHDHHRHSNTRSTLFLTPSARRGRPTVVAFAAGHTNEVDHLVHAYR